MKLWTIFNAVLYGVIIGLLVVICWKIWVQSPPPKPDYVGLEAKLDSLHIVQDSLFTRLDKLTKQLDSLSIQEPVIDTFTEDYSNLPLDSLAGKLRAKLR
jgi:hypothetical protein